LILAAVDTNILVYALLEHGPERKRDIAQRLLLQLSSDGSCVISTQVLKEFANVATKKFIPRMTEQELAAHLEDLQQLNVVVVDSALVNAAVRRHFANQLSFYDALIVEAAKAGGAEVLYSEDMQHGMNFSNLRVVNPFL
jgi:predicted nucleic acid-binding protein